MSRIPKTTNIFLFEKNQKKAELINLLLSDHQDIFNITQIASLNEIIDNSNYENPILIWGQEKISNDFKVEFCTQLRKDTTTPIVVISDNAEVEEQLELINSGAQDVITKLQLNKDRLYSSILFAITRNKKTNIYPTQAKKSTTNHTITAPNFTSILIIMQNKNEALNMLEILSEYQTEETTFKLTYENTLQKSTERLSLEKFDLVICDLNLADLKGIDAYNVLFKDNPDIAKIILIDSWDNNLRKNLDEKNIADFLVKNQYDQEFLIQSIFVCLDKAQIDESIFSKVNMSSKTPKPDDFLLPQNIMETKLQELFKLYTSSKNTISAMVIEIHDPEAYIHNFGKEKFEKIFQKVKIELLNLKRTSDLFSHLDEHKLLIILPGANLTQTHNTALRMWSKINEKLSLPVNIGISSSTHSEVHSAPEMLHQANLALEKAKRFSGNTVEQI